MEHPMAWFGNTLGFREEGVLSNQQIQYYHNPCGFKFDFHILKVIFITKQVSQDKTLSFKFIEASKN